MPIAPSRAPLHSLGHDYQNDAQYDFLSCDIIGCQHQHYMLPTASSMIPLSSLGQDNQNKVNMTSLVI